MSKKLSDLFNREVSEAHVYVSFALIGVAGGALGVLVSPLVFFLATKISKRFGWRVSVRYMLWAIAFAVALPFTAALQIHLADLQLESFRPAGPSLSAERASLNEVVIPDKSYSSDLAIKVLRYRRSNGLYTMSPFFKPIEGDLLIVELEEINHSRTEEASFNSGDGFRLADKQGNSYRELNPEEYREWRYESGIHDRSEPLSPGEVREGVAIFLIQPGSSEYTLIWKGVQINLEEEAVKD